MRTKIITIFSLISIFLINPMFGSSNLYRIIKDEKSRNIKRSVDVRLKRRVSTDQLRSIAKQIKSADRKSYQRTFISYFLPDPIFDTDTWANSHLTAGFFDNDAWASSNFTPDLEIHIYDLNLIEYNNLINSAIDIDQKNLIGQWFELFGSMSRISTLYKKGVKTYFYCQYADGSKQKTEVKIIKTTRGIKFSENINNYFGEYYVINGNKELESWNLNGLFAKCSLLKK